MRRQTISTVYNNITVWCYRGSASRDLLYYYILLKQWRVQGFWQEARSITLLSVDTVFLFDPGLVKLVYRVGGLESSTKHGRRPKLGQELCWFADYCWCWEWIILQTGTVKTPIFVPKKEEFVHHLSRLVQRLGKRSQHTQWHTQGTVKRATKTCNLLCNIAAKQVDKLCYAFYCLAKIKLLQNVESRSTFWTKSLRVGRFTGPRQTCFAGSR